MLGIYKPPWKSDLDLSQATFYLITITTEMVYIKHVVSTIGLKTWGLVYYNNIFALLLSPIFIFITGEGFGIAEVRLYCTLSLFKARGKLTSKGRRKQRTADWAVH